MVVHAYNPSTLKQEYHLSLVGHLSNLMKPCVCVIYKKVKKTKNLLDAVPSSIICNCPPKQIQKQMSINR